MSTRQRDTVDITDRQSKRPRVSPHNVVSPVDPNIHTFSHHQIASQQCPPSNPSLPHASGSMPLNDSIHGEQSRLQSNSLSQHPPVAAASSLTAGLDNSFSRTTISVRPLTRVTPELTAGTDAGISTIDIGNGFAAVSNIIYQSTDVLDFAQGLTPTREPSTSGAILFPPSQPTTSPSHTQHGDQLRPTEYSSNIPDYRYSVPIQSPRESTSTADSSYLPASTAPNPLTTNLGRDALLTYAYHLYHSPSHSVPVGLSPVPVFNIPDTVATTQAYSSQLVPLLTTLKILHPRHLPTLLLLGSVYFALGDLLSSFTVNSEILIIDPNYVEAMCNIGTIMKALSREDDARKWWWKALELQPTYWDAMDNLLNLELASCTSSAGRPRPVDEILPLYRRALEICRSTQSRIIDADGRLLMNIPPDQFHRLENLSCTSANLLHLLGEGNHESVIREYLRAIELAINRHSSSGAERYNFRDLILTTYVAGNLVTSPPESISTGVVRALGFHTCSDLFHLLGQPRFSLMRVVHDAGDRLVDVFLQQGSGTLPTLLLQPEQTSYLPPILFPASSGVLPSICTQIDDEAPIILPSASIRQQTNLMTSNILLSLAKRYQDGLSDAEVYSEINMSFRVSTSLVILLYYLALSLSPSPSAYNNTGVILSRPSVLSTSTVGEIKQNLTGQQMARVYYEKGLHMDPVHPHLLTNMGSLLKDEGRIAEAIQLYSSALKSQPDLDVALANIANAIKDMGHPWDAIPFYRRAVAVNPDLPEAVCGLSNALNSICDWRGRGSINTGISIDEDGSISGEAPITLGWMSKVADICERQLVAAYSENIGIIRATRPLEDWIEMIECTNEGPLHSEERKRWSDMLSIFYIDSGKREGCINEGGILIRLTEWLQQRMQRRWYLKTYGKICQSSHPNPSPSQETYSCYTRLMIPASVEISVPSILPFHAFTHPLDTRTIRLISHRNALRISHATLTKPWMPRHIYPPPPPPSRRLNVGYVSGDLNNHPLSHLMQSVFGFHDHNRFNIHLYATSRSDGSFVRYKIERDCQHFLDVSAWSLPAIVDRIVQDKIHILVNLGGYTKGAKNEIFAARPCPIQISLMGFAGTLAAGWCDYFVCDEVACPKDLSAAERIKVLRDREVTTDRPQQGFILGDQGDPECTDPEWMFTEKFIYMPHTFMVTDHKQSSRDDENLSISERRQIPVARLWDEEANRRKEMKRAIFPKIPLNTVIFANFNQLYKIDPEIFATWLRVLTRIPTSILWLLRFPAAGEEHLARTAKAWAGDEVASRIHFTDVVKKEEHISRARVADLFLDTSECNAHTVAADVLWSGTPILTWPKYRYKLSSRVAASIAYATGFGNEMVVGNVKEYEERAVFLANSLQPNSVEAMADRDRGRGGELINLRRNLFLNRDHMPLFDTERWTRNVENGYEEAWKLWVMGTNEIDEGQTTMGESGGCIWARDDDPVRVRPFSPT